MEVNQPVPPFQVFLDANGPTVYRFLIAAVGPQDADDCFQETFLSALRAYPRLAAGSNLRGWVMTIATRKAFDHLRGQKRRAVPMAEVPEQPVAAPELNGEPELWGAVRTLPPKQRAAVVHRYVFDLTYEDVGHALGCSAEAARANAYEGRRRLKKLLEDTR